MHSLNTRNEFLRLRAQGLSFARIGRQLGVSKPTLMAWSRQAEPEIASLALGTRKQLQKEICASMDEELARLNRQLTAVKQELFSRAIREYPTAAVEEFAGKLRQRIEALSQTKPNASDCGVQGSPLSPSPPTPPPTETTPTSVT